MSVPFSWDGSMLSSTPLIHFGPEIASPCVPAVRPSVGPGCVPVKIWTGSGNWSPLAIVVTGTAKYARVPRSVENFTGLDVA